MRPIQIIRSRLGVSQSEMAEALGCRQNNVSLYERGQAIPPGVAARLIEFAAQRGLRITYDHVYGGSDVPRMAPSTICRP